MEMHLSTNIEDIQRAIANKYLSIDPINEFECMRSQFEVMQSIKQLIEKRKYISNQMAYNGTNSMINQSIINSDCDNFLPTQSVLSAPDQSTSKSKFAQQFQASAVNSALKDVQANCSQETYETVKQYLVNNKVRQAESLEKMTTKLIQQRDQLASQILVLKLQKSNTEKQMEKYKKIVAGVEEEKKNIKKKIDYVLKKQNQVFKLQSSFAFKQKINLQLKKRYERLVGSYLVNQAKIEHMFEQLDKLWNKICEKVQSIDCKGDCWKKDAMRKAKQQLLQQRKLIKQQSVHLQREYEVMGIVSEQFKRIFQEPEKKSLFGQRTNGQTEQNKNLNTNSSQIIENEDNIKIDGKKQ